MIFWIISKTFATVNNGFTKSFWNEFYQKTEALTKPQIFKDILSND
jgi:hypothetical protein